MRCDRQRPTPSCCLVRTTHPLLLGKCPDGHVAAASLAAISDVEVEPKSSAHPCPNPNALRDSPALAGGIWLPQGQGRSCPKLGYMGLSDNHYYLQVGL